MKLNILVVFTFFVCSVACNSTSQTSQPIEVTATRLIADYNNNPLNSDEKYEGKMLIITGIISHYAEMNGTVGVYLNGDLPNDWTIICLIDKSSQPEVYSKLKRGEEGVFVGIGEHKRDEKLVFMTSCKIK